MSLSKSAILAANDAETKSVEVPEWGGEVSVRVMTGAQRDKFESAITLRRGKSGEKMEVAGLRSLLVALTACDETGQLLFEESDIAGLEKKSSTALQRVFDAAAALNGLTAAGAEEAGADFTPDQS